MKPEPKPPCPENIPAIDQNNSSIHTEKPQLPPKVLELLENPRLIISMTCCHNKVIFKFHEKKTVELRCVFGDLVKCLPCNIFLQVHRSWVIKMYCMKEEWHCETCGWIKLTDNQRYNVSETYIQNFILLLSFMIKQQRIREKSEGTRPC
jgi:hypothetical protein